MIDVFLVPVGADRHELYCESAPDDGPSDAVPAKATWRARAAGFGRRVIAEGERARDGAAPEGGRLRRVVAKWLARAVARQRLLWYLRGRTDARLWHPDRLVGERARQLLRANLQRAIARHQRWFIVDAALTLAALPLMVLPGPNVLGYFFAFRLVGHYLSLGGARRGLRVVQWTLVPTPQLSELGDLAQLDPASRAARAREIAQGLGLPRLPLFLDDLASR